MTAICFTLLTAPAQASNQGGGGALLFLALLYLGPVVLAGLCVVSSIYLTVARRQSPPRRWVRRAAKFSLVMAALAIMGGLGAVAIMGGRTDDLMAGGWAMLVPAVAICSAVLGLAHLGGAAMSGRAWLLQRLMVWCIPLLVPAVIGLQSARRQAAETQRDKNLMQRLSGHFLGTLGLAFVDDGDRLFAVGYGGNKKRHLQLWKQENNQWKREDSNVELPDKVTVAAVNRASGRALLHSYKAFWLVDITDLSSAKKMASTEDAFSSLAISADGSLGAAGGNGDVLVWSLPDGKQLGHFKPLEKRIDALAFSRDNETLVVTDFNKKLLVIDAKDGKTRCTMSGPGAHASSLWVAPDGKTLLTGPFEGGVYRWDLSRCASLGLFARSRVRVTALALAPGGDQLVLGDEQSEVHLVPYPAGGERVTTIGQVYPKPSPHGLTSITDLVFHPNKPLLVAAAKANHNTIALFRWATTQ